MLCCRNICGTTPALSLHSGKTKVWNRSGVEAGVSEQRQAEVATPGWRGNPSLPTFEQGFKVSGVTFGHPDFIKRFLQRKIDEHRVLLERIPIIPDVQAAWLILSYCASAKSNFFLRGVSPAHSGDFARNHDDGIWRCFRQILKLSPDHRVEEVASLPPRHGGLGLRSAQRIHPAAHWASWADALAMIQQRHPASVDTIVGVLENNAESVSIRCLLDCVRKLAETGFEVPDWTDLAEGKVPGDEGEDDPCQPKIGWQKRAANSIEERFFSNTVSSLGDSERAFALSQCGPLASVDSQPFRLLLLRRLCQPLPCVTATAGVAVLSTLAITGQLGHI